MPRKSLRKLAGCIVIELLGTWVAAAADYQFKAGYATYGQARALAIEDQRGHRALIVMGAFSIPLPISDLIAASAIKEYNLERPNLLIRSVASGDPKPVDARTAMGAALGALQPAILIYGNSRLTVSTHDGRCQVGISAEASFESCNTPVGDTVRGQIRAALRLVNLPHPLQSRDDAAPQPVAIQAIAIGPVVILAAPTNLAQPGRHMILAVTPAVEEDPQLNAALGDVYLRVGGRPK
jgi:hypothetical protein